MNLRRFEPQVFLFLIPRHFFWELSAYN